MSRTVTFGEIMLRLSPEAHKRFSQAESFDVNYGGGEANVAASLSQFGLESSLVTRIPENEIGDSCLASLRKLGVSTGQVLRGGERLGIYFLETGSVQRGSKVIYDRANSSFSSIKPGMFDWDDMLRDADWFHWTGITPAISDTAAAVCLEAVKAAKKKGLTVSCDINYRGKLWKWGKKASDIMPALVSESDLLIGNEEDAEIVFGISAQGVDLTGGEITASQYKSVAEGLMKTFPNIKKVAITLRGSISASHNTWSGILYNGHEMFTAPVYQITDIVDRVGGGDAFAAGLIYGIKELKNDAEAIRFAVAASCLKHSIFGDVNLVTVSEVEKLMMGDASGRVAR